MMREEKVKTGLFGNPKPPARVLLAGAMGYESLDAAWSAYENRLLVESFENHSALIELGKGLRARCSMMNTPIHMSSIRENSCPFVVQSRSRFLRSNDD
jgi:hypothetical protein